MQLLKFWFEIGTFSVRQLELGDEIMFLELGATILGLIQGILVMLNKRSNWIFYILQMLFLIVFSSINHLYGDITNNSVYLVMGIVGFILWNKNSKSSEITSCKLKEKIMYTAIIVLGTIIVSLILKNTDDPLPILDAFTTISSFVATYYMMKKRIDTWIIWFINDIFYAVEYFILPNQALYLFALNIIWTGMAVASYINWKKIMNGKSNMKKIYFAGKFNLLKNNNLTLEERLVNDFRSKILGDSKKLTYATENLELDNGFIYSGPFYCEQASNGDFTSTDCNIVLKAEYEAISKCDIYFVLFDQKFSVGSIVELDWALEMNKDIVIFYKEEDSMYDIKSEYWFAIANALSKSQNVKVFKFNDINSVVNKIIKGEIFNEV